MSDCCVEADPPPRVPLTDEARSRQVEAQFASRRHALRLWDRVQRAMRGLP